MASDCLDCAFADCDTCADLSPSGYRECCCGRITDPDAYDDEDWTDDDVADTTHPERGDGHG